MVDPRKLRVGDRVIITDSWIAPIVAVDIMGYVYEGGVRVDFAEVAGYGDIWIDRPLSLDEVKREIVAWLR